MHPALEMSGGVKHTPPPAPGPPLESRLAPLRAQPDLSVSINVDSSTHPAHAASAVSRKAAAKAAATAQLQPDSLRYLHVDAYGRPLPPWMEFGKQPRDTRWNFHMSRLHTLMTDASSSWAAYLISMVVVTAILLSTCSFCLETLPPYQPHRNPTAVDVFFYIEMVTIQIFALDYLLRLLSAPAKAKFVVEGMNIIDLISILPWYITIGLASDFNGTSVFRVIRLVRVFRVLKLGGRDTKLLVVTTALHQSLDMLGLMVFFVSLLIITFSSLEYFAEQGDWDAQLGYYVRPREPSFLSDGNPRPSPFESIPAGFWWAIVTLMTVGYGDNYPITVVGKFIAGVAMLCGILALALPISVVGNNFSSGWQAHKAAEEAKKKLLETGTFAQATAPEITEMMRQLALHTGNLEDLIRLHTVSEGILDSTATHLRAGLGKLRLELSMEAQTLSVLSPRGSALPPAALAPWAEVHTPPAHSPASGTRHTGMMDELHNVRSEAMIDERMGSCLLSPDATAPSGIVPREEPSATRRSGDRRSGGRVSGSGSLTSGALLQARVVERLQEEALDRYKKEAAELGVVQASLDTRLAHLATTQLATRALLGLDVPVDVEEAQVAVNQVEYLRTRTKDLKQTLRKLCAEVSGLGEDAVALESRLARGDGSSRPSHMLHMVMSKARIPGLSGRSTPIHSSNNLVLGVPSARKLGVAGSGALVSCSNLGPGHSMEPEANIGGDGAVKAAPSSSGSGTDGVDNL